MIPFLKARIEGLKRAFDTYVEQRIKTRLVDWSELSTYKIKNRIKRWFGMQYLKTRIDDFHKDLWGYIILPVAVAVFLALISAPVWAGNAVLTWTLPTASEACEADTTVPDIASTEIWQLMHTGGPTDTTVTFSGLVPGDYTYVSSVTDTDGLTSRFSGTSTKSVDSLTVEDDKAYIVFQSGGKFIAFIIGTVPVGTVCDPDSMVKGEFDFLPFTAYGVPVDDVTITGDTEPLIALAVCQ